MLVEGKRFSYYDIVLFLCIALEVLFSVYAKKFFGQTVNAFGYLISSLTFGVCLLAKFYKKPVIIAAPASRRWLAGVFVVLCLLAVIIITIDASKIMTRIPIGLSSSDIIPTVKELCTRYLNGSFVYEPIEKFGYHLPVTYLPMQWMPYLIAEKGHFDYRWIAIGIWLLTSVIVLVRSYRSSSIVVQVSGPLALALSYFYICHYNDTIIGHTIEIMVAGYYMLLICSLNSGNAIFRGLIIGICLMSRYSLLLWLPLATAVVWWAEPRKQFWQTVITVALFVGVIYIIPFLSKDWGLFYRGYKYYDTSALGEWKHINRATGKPFHLYVGQGIAFKFFELDAIPITQRLKLLQKTHVICSLGTTLLLGVWYWFKRNNIHHRIFLMGSFKIYLAIFLFFIQVPYLYLMTVSLFVSIAIFFEQSRYRLKPIS
jgi:hypothetical protein